jgi:cell division protein FtsB
LWAGPERAILEAMTPDENHENLADELDEQADKLAQESEQLADEIKDVRDDWQAKRQDPAVPGAVPPKKDDSD